MASARSHPALSLLPPDLSACTIGYARMWEILDALFDLFGAVPPRRVSVADRYAMKRKVRELRKREKERSREKERADRSAASSRS